ncbi:MAG TPA: TonB-dependent receptor [Bryobacteraceae bacterium]|jgi:hypothetical protein
MALFTRLLLGFSVAGLLLVGLDAQTQNAAISGTVSDATGAVLAGASVQVRNAGTGVTQNVVSDEQGRYRAADLQIGEYEVQASRMGFQTVVHKGITLTVGSQLVVDFSLPVGQAQQTVTVQGEVSVVDTQSTAVGALVESKQVRDLPLNGRNFTQLLTLAPGVTQIPLNGPGGGSTFYGNGQKYSIAGSRPSGQAYLLDDQDMTNFWNNGPGAGGLGTALGVEAIAEFQTLTNTYSSEFGGNGAVINASSRPGTNGFHGSAYEFLRNDKLEDRNFFDVQSGAPPYHQNQFGGSVGGPIKKDKIFFFANYEGLRKSQVTSSIVTVPDACAHQFLTTASGSGGCGAPVPQNNTPFATNPAVQSAIRNTMVLWPMPNYNPELITAAGAPSETGQAVVLDPLKGHENYILGRIDYNISAKDTLFVRYVLDYAQRNFTTGIPYWPELDTTRDHFVNIEERRILSPSMANALHIGFSRTWEAATVSGSPTVANGVVTPGTIASSGNHPLQFFGTQAGREDGTIATFSGLTAIGASTTLPFYLVPNKFAYGDDVIWTHGAHSVKFGGMATRYRENTWAPFVVGGNWTFPNITAFLQGAASQVQGQVSDVQNPTSDATKDYRYWLFEAYVEDQWKVSNKLTLTYGIRYSPTTIISDVRHQMYNLIDPYTPGGEFVPVTTSSASNPSLRNWDPRVGLAWDPFADHKTSIRASFGMFHNVLLSRDLNYWLQPPFLTATQTSAQGLLYPSLFSNLGPGANVVNVPTNGTLSITNGDYYGVHSTPYQMQWNFNIQRELFPNSVFSVGYIGSHNLHMFIQRDFNSPTPCLSATAGCFYDGAPTYSSATGVANRRLDPQYNSLQLADNLADAHFESLETSFDHRFSSGWQTQVSYTFSKSIDNGSGTYGLDGGGISSQPFNVAVDRGLSNFNHTHNFRVSGLYNLPVHASGFVGAIVNGWQVVGVFTYLSGASFNPTSAPNRVFTGTGSNGGRPNWVAGCNLYSGFETLSAWFNTACFALQPIGTYGNAGRDTIVGPNLWNLDNSLTKDFRIKEAVTVQLRAEAFNIMNHPSFQLLNTNTQIFAGAGVNASAGKIQATNSQPRQVQLALKILF